MTFRGLAHRNLLTGPSLLWFIFLFYLSGPCSGQIYYYNGFGYTVSGLDITITGYTGPGGAIEIPATIRWTTGITGTITSIGNNAFYDSGVVTSVAIPDTVTSIGNDAFGGCINLASVNIPGSVTNIGIFAFAQTRLTSVTIPTTVTDIVNWAFANCSGLTSVYFQGDAPSLSFGVNTFDYAAPSFSIYYPSTASGWSTPSWWGYPAQPYTYQPAGQQALLALTFGSGAVTPSFNQLKPGANYQLQVSTDLSTWSNTGPSFTATNASEAYAQAFYLTNANQLFVRLLSAP
jgi:hypothetical protein